MTAGPSASSLALLFLYKGGDIAYNATRRKILGFSLPLPDNAATSLEIEKMQAPPPPHAY